MVIFQQCEFFQRAKTTKVWVYYNIADKVSDADQYFVSRWWSFVSLSYQPILITLVQVLQIALYHIRYNTQTQDTTTSSPWVVVIVAVV